ncbi:uncharacterized protein LOC143226320 isoform X2 [Tachypleus tridentatus]|uniref:uncharacterized protein LOC143226320 isoform X2 n=1 Tax=Tachypleus tridentatus TaxID=6853 RepID=UPI003FD08954
MKILQVLILSLEIVFLVIQLISLACTHWNSWDLRFNWTRSLEKVNGRPESEGYLMSKGHAGLWSRCMQLYDVRTKTNETRALVDKCMSNFDKEGVRPYSYGKTCKTAASGLCVTQGVITGLLLLYLNLNMFYKRTPTVLEHFRLPLLLGQGAVSVVVPVVYISGNMEELVHQLQTTYGLLLIVDMNVWYAHSWGFWLQTSLPILWVFIMGVMVSLGSSTVTVENKKRKPPSEDKTNEEPEAPELQALQSTSVVVSSSGHQCEYLTV